MLGIEVYEAKTPETKAPKKTVRHSLRFGLSAWRCARGEIHRCRNLCRCKIGPVRPHDLVVTDLPIPAFSLMIFGLNTAS